MRYDFESTFDIIRVLNKKFNRSDNAKDSYALMLAMKKEFQMCVDIIERDAGTYRTAMVRTLIEEAAENEKS